MPSRPKRVPVVYTFMGNRPPRPIPQHGGRVLASPQHSFDRMMAEWRAAADRAHRAQHDYVSHIP